MYFSFNWHYHPYYELTLIIEGSGKLFVGDNISNYNDMNLALIGHDLPHAYESDMLTNENKHSALIIQFKKAFIGSYNLNRSEFHDINNLLQQASCGICFKPETAHLVMRKLAAFDSLNGLLKWLNLMDILNTLGNSKDRALLSSRFIEPSSPVDYHSLIDRVCDYIFQHYNEDIALQEIAGISHLSVASFCRFIKKNTGKTFNEYLNFIRIGIACKLLIHSDSSITEICYQCGYNNLSNFNRHFREQKKMTPGEYRKQFRRAEE